MIEIEKLQNITTFQGNAPFEEASTTPTNGEDGSGDPVSPTEKEKPNYDDFVEMNTKLLNQVSSYVVIVIYSLNSKN